MVNKKRINKLSVGSYTFDIVNYIILSLFLLACAYPFYYVFICSIASKADISLGVYLWPKEVVWDTYAKLLTGTEIPGAFTISVLRATISTILSVGASSLFAYLVTQQDMFARKFVYRFMIITMYVSGGLIPGYLTMKIYGLHNNFLLYVIPGMVHAFYVILVKTYIESLPASLEESASLDGAGFFKIFFWIIFPLCKPVIATIAVFNLVGSWNHYFDNYLMVSDPRLQTLPVVLLKFLKEAENIATMMKQAAEDGNIAAVGQIGQLSPITAESVRNAATIITVVPIMCVYPLLQKYYTKGVMMGAVKG